MNCAAFWRCPVSVLWRLACAVGWLALFCARQPHVQPARAQEQQQADAHINVFNTASILSRHKSSHAINMLEEKDALRGTKAAPTAFESQLGLGLQNRKASARRSHCALTHSTPMADTQPDTVPTPGAVPAVTEPTPAADAPPVAAAAAVAAPVGAREVTEASNLCDKSGNLLQTAVGWSRRPLITSPLSGLHRFRKKRSVT